MSTSPNGNTRVALPDADRQRLEGKKKRSCFERIRQAVRMGFIIAFFTILATSLPVAILGWVPPPTSSYMLQKRLQAPATKRNPATIRYKWVDYQDISPYMPLAAVASEDQLFPFHHGFDFKAIRKAIAYNQKSSRIRGASTISQQVVKNLFLWPGRNFLRKGLEAYFTLLVECLWSKRRILEVYLNIVEMGDRVFGVGAASEVYFKKPPKDLTQGQAALLAAILPNPIVHSAKSPSRYILKRKNWIQRQMRQLGGTRYLEEL